MTKKEIWVKLFEWLRGRYRELIEDWSFREGNIGMKARLFVDAQFTEYWQQILNFAKTGTEDDVKFLRKIIKKAVDLESGNGNTYIDEKKKLALEYIEKVGGVYEHQLAKKIMDSDIGSRINNAVVKTVVGFLEKEGKIKKEANKWLLVEKKNEKEKGINEEIYEG